MLLSLLPFPSLLPQSIPDTSTILTIIQILLQLQLWLLLLSILRLLLLIQQLHLLPLALLLPYYPLQLCFQKCIYYNTIRPYYQGYQSTTELGTLIVPFTRDPYDRIPPPTMSAFVGSIFLCLNCVNRDLPLCLRYTYGFYWKSMNVWARICFWMFSNSVCYCVAIPDGSSAQATRFLYWYIRNSVRNRWLSKADVSPFWDLSR